MSRVVVYGYEVTESDMACADGDVQEQPLGSSLHCYMTVTAVPSLQNCQAYLNKTFICICICICKHLLN